MTFSIVGHDPITGELGVAVASKFLAVGSLVPWAKAGVGAIATQSWANVEYGTHGLDLMAKGLPAKEALDELVQKDMNSAVRQVGMVDAKGTSASFTGSECHSWAGGLIGLHFACQGNILVDEKTIESMAYTFQHTEGDLAYRLLQALLAGEQAGGDSRGKQSASLLVVKEGAGYGGNHDRYIDLRVDDHPEPVLELIRIHDLHQLYFKKSAPQDILPIEDELKERLLTYLHTLGFLAKDEKVSDSELFEALHHYQLIENFDERIQESGFVDKLVVSFMQKTVERNRQK